METSHYVLGGQYEVKTAAHEMRMSLWVYAPIILERATQKRVLDLSHGPWDLRRLGEDDGRIVLTLARYPEGGREHVVEVDPSQGIAIVEGVMHPLGEIDAALAAIA
ncbi:MULTISPECIES: hypothetical protein [unclassified Halomonas]|uniref:hypothetical protein n=1 Tax=unclassified Halomonas TaxID=2609666 RepID=UPI00209D436D|nr:MULTISPECIES: hypothetical protein [unclassified Halomonas]MCP1313694.1 hypothetical protein [Halomonas sp. 707D7]MCP1327064.1 hypothetical protein [Halomonas sp. 707D4]